MPLLISLLSRAKATPQNTQFAVIAHRYPPWKQCRAFGDARMLGLRNVDDLTPISADPDSPPWASDVYTDNEGRAGKKLDVRQLLVDEDFMEISV